MSGKCTIRALELSALICLVWALLIGILVIIDEIIMRIHIENSVIRGIFRVGISFSLLGIWLLLWWKMTIYYYRHKVSKGDTCEI